MNDYGKRDDCASAVDSPSSAGQKALEAIELSVIEKRPAPEWAIREVARCYTFFKTGRPVSGWIAEEVGAKAPKSLGDAFGVAPRRGEHLEKVRLRVNSTPRLNALFSGAGSLRRTRDRAEAARLLGLTEKQVKEWAPKSRVNVRGNKEMHQQLNAHDAPAHDPFRLLEKVPKK